MPPVYRSLADFVLVLHFGFILFVVFGGLLVLWRLWVAWLHVPAAIWGILIECADFLCPLTSLEVWFQQRSGEAGYSGGFIDHYIAPVVYPPGLARWHQIVIAAFVLVFNAAIYWRIVTRRRRCARSP